MERAMATVTRSAVERVEAAGAVVSSATDSVHVGGTGVTPQVQELARKQMVGQRMRMRIAPDGAMELLDRPAASAPGEAAAPPRLPGTLPAMPVVVGATWVRAMLVPWGGPAAPGREAPRLDVTFRLDSLARPAKSGAATLGYVSFAGGVRDGHEQSAKGAPPGRVEGSLVVDLARGWVVASRAIFLLDGMLTPPAPPDGKGAAPAPVPVRVVVTQKLRVL
jgi:hypothetical protein